MLTGSVDRLRQPVECVIEIDGTEIRELYPYLDEVTVDMNRDSADIGILRFSTFRDESGNWFVQDYGESAPLLRPWRSAVIKAVFGDHSEELMRGYIREINPDYPENMGEAMVNVVIQDESILLDREQVNKIWVTSEDAVLNDADLVQLISAEYQLDTNTQPGLDNVSLANNSTYVQLLRERADANGYEFYVREGVVNFHPVDLQGEPQPSIKLYAGTETSCTSFNVRFDGHKPDEIVLTNASETGADVIEQSFTPDHLLLGSSSADSNSSGLGPFKWNIISSNGYDVLEKHSRAQARANENAWKITAEGVLDGSVYGHVLLNYKLVQVTGAGTNMDGVYYVDSVRHSITQTGYRQSFTLLRNATGVQGAASQLSSISNLL